MARRIRSNKKDIRQMQLKLKTNKRKTFVVILMLILFLSSIYGYNFYTKSEEIPTKLITFKELSTDNNNKDDFASSLEVKQDTDGRYYVILPEKLDGFYVSNYYVKNEDVILKDETVDEEVSDEETNTMVEDLENNDLTNNVLENTTIETNIIEESNSITTSYVKGEKRLYLTSLTENVVESEKENFENTNTTSNKNDNTINTNTSNSNSVENENIISSTNNISNTASENKVTNNTIDNTANTNSTNNNQTIKNENISTTNTIVTNNVENNVVEDLRNTTGDEVIDELNSLSTSYNPDEYTAYHVGDKLYLTSNDKETYKRQDFEVYAFYKTTTSVVSGEKLYERDLVNDSNENVRVTLTGTFPKNALLNVTLGDDLIQEARIRLSDEYYNFSVLSAAKLQVMSDDQEFSISDEGITPTLKMELKNSSKELNNNKTEVYQLTNENAENISNDIALLDGSKEEKVASLDKVSDVAVLDSQDTMSDSKVLEENTEAEVNANYEDVTYTSNSVEFTVDNLDGMFAILYVATAEAGTVEIDNVEDDYNYYKGLNYTTNDISGEDGGKDAGLYTDDNLKTIQINYNGTSYNDIEDMLADKIEYFFDVSSKVPDTSSAKEDRETTSLSEVSHSQNYITDILTSKYQYEDDEDNDLLSEYIDTSGNWSITVRYTYYDVSDGTPVESTNVTSETYPRTRKKKDYIYTDTTTITTKTTTPVLVVPKDSSGNLIQYTVPENSSYNITSVTNGYYNIGDIIIGEIVTQTSGYKVTTGYVKDHPEETIMPTTTTLESTESTQPCYNSERIYYSDVTYSGTGLGSLIIIDSTGLYLNLVTPFQTSGGTIFDLQDCVESISYTAEYYTKSIYNGKISRNSYAVTSSNSCGYLSAEDDEDDINKFIYKDTVVKGSTIDLIDNPFTSRPYIKKVKDELYSDSDGKILDSSGNVITDSAGNELNVNMFYDNLSLVENYSDFVWNYKQDASTSESANNAPIMLGFNGWKSKDSTINTKIGLDSDGVTQTLALNSDISGSDYGTIDLYADWEIANVIYASPNGDNNNDGLSLDTPVNSLSTAYSKLSSNVTTATSGTFARDLNIIVVCATKSGTTYNSGSYYNQSYCLGSSTPYTMTGVANKIDFSQYVSIEITSGTHTFNVAAQFDNLKFNASTGNSGYTNDDQITSTRKLSDDATNINCNGYNVRIGRNITTNTLIAQLLVGGAASSSKVVVESGKYTGIYCEMPETDLSDTTLTAPRKFIVGSDYDRKNNINNVGNNKLNVYAQIVNRDSYHNISRADGKAISQLVIKSGNIGVELFEKVATNEDDCPYSGIYVGGRDSVKYRWNGRGYEVVGIYEDDGDREIYVEGGNIANIIGGLDTPKDSNTTVKTKIYVKGSDADIQNIVGGAGLSTTYGDRYIQVTAGTIEYSISGGSNGVEASDSDSSGIVEGNTLIYVGGSARVGDTSTTNNRLQLGETKTIKDTTTKICDGTTSLYGVRYGSIIGAGNGNRASAEYGRVKSSHIIVDGDAQIAYDVVGGGNYGTVGNGSSSTSSATTENEVKKYTDVSKTITTTTTCLITNGTVVNSSYFMGNTLSGSSFNSATLTNYEPKESYRWTIIPQSGGGYYIMDSGGKYLNITKNVYYQNGYWSGYWYYSGSVQDYVTFSLSSTPTLWNFNSNGELIKNYSGTLNYTNDYGWSQTYTYNSTYCLAYDSGGFTYKDITNYDPGNYDIYFLTYELKSVAASDVEITRGDNVVTKIDIYGGNINHSVYGGANQNNIHGSVEINQYGGIVNQTIYGGCNSSGTIEETTYIYIAGGTINAGTQDEVTDDSDGDAIFAGGYGSSTEISSAASVKITDDKDDVHIYGDIYGGSAQGIVDGKSTVYITDSKLKTIYIKGDIYGAGKGTTSTQSQNLSDIVVFVDGGDYNISTTNRARVFGGANVNGKIVGNITVTIGKNNSTKVYQVYGGGNNAIVTSGNSTTYNDYVFLDSYAEVEEAFNGGNNAGLDTNFNPEITADGAKITTGIYGGSNTSGTLDKTSVVIKNVTTDPLTFGGGKGESTIITNDTIVSISASTVNDVYGGGDAGTVGGTTAVGITAFSTIDNAFGGGRGATATVTGKTTIGVYKSTINEYIFGGGDLAQSLDTTLVEIWDSTIKKEVYAGGNGQDEVTAADGTTIKNGSVSGEAKVIIANDAIIGDGTTGNGNVYGGGKGKSATTGSTDVNILYQNDIDGVSVPATKQSKIMNNVYGGGNNGKVTGSTKVTIKNATVLNEVFGAGLGTDATVGENASVTIADSSVIGNKTSNIVGSIYGGGDNGSVTGSTTVKFDDSTVYDSIFGAGKGTSAVVGKDTKVTIGKEDTTKIDNIGKADTIKDTDGKTYGSVYGGGYAGNVTGNTSVEIESANVNCFVYGAGKGSDEDANVAKVSGNATTTLTNVTIGTSDDSSIGDIYGGGEYANVGGNTDINAIDSTIYGSAFGGGKGLSGDKAFACVLGNSHLSLQGDTIVYESAYGSGNNAPTGDGETTTNEKGKPIPENYTEENHLNSIIDISGAIVKKSVYGGANHAQIFGDTYVNIGIDAINNYYDIENQKSYKIGSINIGDTIFGGSESADASVQEIDFDSICVFGDTNINIDGNKYDSTGGYTIDLLGSIYASGNASRASSWTTNEDYADGNKNGHIVIKNYGTTENLKRLPSIQRATDLKLYNTDLILTGALNSAKTTDPTKYSLNIIGSLSLIDNSRIYLDAITNYLCGYNSLKDDRAFLHEDSTGTVKYVIVNNEVRDGSESGTIIAYYKDGSYYSDSEFKNKLEDSSTEVTKIKNYDKDVTYIEESITTPVYETTNITNLHEDKDGNVLYAVVGNEVRDGSATGTLIAYYNDGYYYSDSTFENKYGEDSTQVTKIADYDKQVENIVTTAFTTNVDNRIYMFNGVVNFNICKGDDPSKNSDTSWGQVKGMTFLGVFTDTGTSIYEGMYDDSFNAGDTISFEQRDFVTSIAKGAHTDTPEQDLHIDGFYTNYEMLNKEYRTNLETGDEDIELTSSNYSSYYVNSYTAYIGVDPQDDIYYRWVVGPDSNVYSYNVDLVASKFTSLGSKTLNLEKLNFANAIYDFKSFKVISKTNDDLTLTDSSNIPLVNSNEDEANLKFALTMKTANSGWTKGTTLDFKDESDTLSVTPESGYTTEFQHENLSKEPSIIFKLDNSTNITKNQENIGIYRATFDVTYHPSKYVEQRATMVVTISISTIKYEGSGYDGAITPGRTYTTFANDTQTNITKNSTFTTYFRLSDDSFDTKYTKDVEGNKIVDTTMTNKFRALYPTSYRVLLTENRLPQGAEITMIDYSVDKSEANGGPRYYYYEVTGLEGKTDDNAFYQYKLQDFYVMGSEDEKFDENYWKDKYLKTYTSGSDVKQYEIEYFQFIVDLSNATYGSEAETLIPKGQVRFAIMGEDPVLDEDSNPTYDADGSAITTQVALAEVYNDMKTEINYAVFNKSAAIDINPSITKSKVYVGNTVEIDSNISYEVTAVNGNNIHDTTYFDKKIGVKITLLKKNSSGVYEPCSGAQLLGTYFKVNGVNYYPRTDGTTRLKVADNANASVEVTIYMNTQDSAMTSGDYQIEISTFASADGIYYGDGSNLSKTKKIDITFINETYGLKSTIADNDAIIDVNSGYTLDDKGYTSTTDKVVNVQLDYLSGYDNPYIAVSIERRKYDKIFDMTYSEGDLLDLFTKDFSTSVTKDDAEIKEDKTLEKITALDTNAYTTITGDLDNKYLLMDKDDIYNVINTSDTTINTPINLSFNIDDTDLTSGTYKIVFTLYDVTKDFTISVETTTTDKKGNVTTTSTPKNVDLYEKVGDIYSYIIVK